MTQIVSGMVGGKQLSGRFEVEIRSGRMAIAAFTHAGIPLFNIIVMDDGVKTNLYAQQAGGLLPEWMVSDIMIAYWPVDSVGSYLATQGMKLIVDARSRQVIDSKGKQIVLITYAKDDQTLNMNIGASMSLANHQQNYELAVQTVALSKAEE